MCGSIRTKGLSRTLLGLMLAAVSMLAIAGTAGAAPLSYTFDSSNQGWLESQDNGPHTTSAEFQPTGGNPGGHLTARDIGPETGCDDGMDPCDLLTFYSPIVHTMGDNYGGTASFDLRSSVPPEFAAEFLLLPSGPNYLDGLIAESNDTSFNHLSIQLVETGRWAICPYAGGTCAPASQGQFIGLLNSSDEIAVVVDVGPNGTGETYDLDNVALSEGTGPPAPAAPAKPHRKKCKKHKNRAAKKKCKKHKQKRRAASVPFRG